MKITIRDRIKALFARDEFEFWFVNFTDKEKELLQMDSFELAEVIEDKPKTKEGVFAAHILQSRLVTSQNRAVYISMVVNLLCVIIGAFLGAYIKK